MTNEEFNRFSALHKQMVDKMNEDELYKAAGDLLRSTEQFLECVKRQNELTRQIKDRLDFLKGISPEKIINQKQGETK